MNSSLLTVVTSGALSISTTGDTIEVYSEITIMGSATATTELTINGTTGIILAGGTQLNIGNIRSLTVVSGAGIVAKGYKVNTNQQFM